MKRGRRIVFLLLVSTALFDQHSDPQFRPFADDHFAAPGALQDPAQPVHSSNGYAYAPNLGKRGARLPAHDTTDRPATMASQSSSRVRSDLSEAKSAKNHTKP